MIKFLPKIIKKHLKLTRFEADRLRIAKESFPAVMSTGKTLNKIIKNRASLCRFGDAEFDICNFKNQNDPYQKPSKKLSSRLKQILAASQKDNLIIAVPPFNSEHNNLPYFYKSLSFWEWYWMDRCEKILPLLGNQEYGNSFVSRDAVFYENKISDIKKIWDKRDVVFVVSRQGRFVFDERLFSNINSKHFILIPPTNAFDDYEKILKEAVQYHKSSLFLIAAGPTATVLAFDLWKKGYQAIDIGHITNCYLQYLGEAKAPEATPMRKTEK